MSEPEPKPVTPAKRTGSLSPLPREEYVEQAHFFSVLAERMAENSPAQEVLGAMREEVLATTKLPLAIDFLLSELRHQGTFRGDAAAVALLHAISVLRDGRSGE